MKRVTDKQKRIYEFIRSFLIENHSIPTMQEISTRFNFNSPNAAQEHVKALERKGYLTKHRKGSSKKHGYRIAGFTVILEPSLGHIK